MISSLKLGKKGKQAPAAEIPPGQRVYAVGDVHGRLDLFKPLMKQIIADLEASPELESTIILLGDLVDRGPDSAGVIAFARKIAKTQNLRVLMGNHEEMFLASLKDKEVLKHFLRFGGRETICSYGLSEKKIAAMSVGEIQKFMKDAIPAKDVEFLKGAEDMIIMGGYLFAHAGIHPERTVKKQKPQDLHWIRNVFLDHEGPLSHVVVHGHTIVKEPEERRYRVGIDTGAFRTGRLTALVLEGTGRRYIETRTRQDGSVRIKTRKAA